MAYSRTISQNFVPRSSHQYWQGYIDIRLFRQAHAHFPRLYFDNISLAYQAQDAFPTDRPKSKIKSGIKHNHRGYYIRAREYDRRITQPPYCGDYLRGVWDAFPQPTVDPLTNNLILTHTDVQLDEFIRQLSQTTYLDHQHDRHIPIIDLPRTTKVNTRRRRLTLTPQQAYMLATYFRHPGAEPAYDHDNPLYSYLTIPDSSVKYYHPLSTGH